MWIAEVAHWMALIPLVWLTWLGFRGASRDVAWWWIATAFAVSWFADTAAHFTPQANNAWLSLVYPVSQTAIVGAVLLPRRRAVGLLAVLIGTSIVAILWHGVEMPDVVLRSVAWLAVVAIVWSERALPSRLRLCLAVYFGLGLVTWLVHVRWLIVPTWYPYQATRLAGLVLFCWATAQPTPILRLAKS